LAFPGAPTSKTDEFVDDVAVLLVAFEVDAGTAMLVVVLLFNDGDADDGGVVVKADIAAKIVMIAATIIRLKVTVFLAFSSWPLNNHT
jgi:hypothetical protein